jgi:pimeloyl-ACP methyl ester carboxylesterase
VVLLGGDLGGPVIQDLALRYPEWVDRMVLFNSPLPYDKERMAGMRTRPAREASDYFVLKPKHSGFYDTTLETLLESLAIRRVIVTGMAGNICVLFTANDAYMRGLRVIAPSDCIVSNTPEDNAHALRQIAIVLKGRLTPSDRLTFHGPAARRRSPRVGV